MEPAALRSSRYRRSDSGHRSPNFRETVWNSWEALPSISVDLDAPDNAIETSDKDRDNVNGDAGDTDAWDLSGKALEDVVKQQEEAVAWLWQHRGVRRDGGGSLHPARRASGHEHPPACSEDNDERDKTEENDELDDTEYCEDCDVEEDAACVIPGDFQQTLGCHLNQSACRAGRAFRKKAEDPAAEDEQAVGWELRVEDEETAECLPPLPQQLTTCQEDVISQRLSTCLQLLQGAPYQDCNQCVTTLSGETRKPSPRLRCTLDGTMMIYTQQHWKVDTRHKVSCSAISCDKNRLTSGELAERLNNLEVVLLYLQVQYHSRMSCARLKLLCRLKKTLSCLHGCLLKREAEESLVVVQRLHRKLDRTGDFRRHWRPVPSGGEKFRFIAESLDCTPRVEAADEWLRAFLPEPEKASLGHILSDTDPTVPETVGKRMAFTKMRGRSTRLHDLFTRDPYEDMLEHFHFALA